MLLFTISARCKVRQGNHRTSQIRTSLRNGLKFVNEMSICVTLMAITNNHISGTPCLWNIIQTLSVLKLIFMNRPKQILLSMKHVN